MRCVADYIEREQGFYWDIAAPDKYFDLLRHYSNGIVGAAIRPQEEACSMVGAAIRPQEEASSIVKAINITERKLRKVIHETPTKEKQIQDAFESLLVGADIPYSREKLTFEYSSRAYRPDFTMESINSAIEIKLCTTLIREKEIVSEINDDILAYKTRFANILFVVYDLGAIRDVDRFASEFELHENVVVRIIKH